MSRVESRFLALIVVQTVHSAEECVGRLWEVFPRAAFVAGLFSNNLALGFVIANLLVVTIGFWCFVWPVRHRWKAAKVVVVLWILIELINGSAHVARSILNWHYDPGVATAPLLFILALWLLPALRDLDRTKA